MKRIISLLGILILSVLMWPSSQARAGGWAVITLDEFPTSVVAGQPLTIGFMIRQHGLSPASGYSPRVTAIHQQTNQRVTATAKPGRGEGHYEARLTFPQAGVWSWAINPYFNQPMPPLTVVEAQTVD